MMNKHHLEILNSIKKATNKNYPTMDCLSIMMSLLRLDIQPNEYLGQHFLINPSLLNYMTETVDGGVVIEVGPGLGQLTEPLLKKANSVYAIEIDRRFETVLQELEDRYPSLALTYGDALAILPKLLPKLVKQEKTDLQIIANLPYHITESFMQIVLRYPIDLKLLVGESFARKAFLSNPNDIAYTNLSLLINAFYTPISISEVARDDFYPEPRTKSRIIEFQYRPPDEVSKGDYLIRQLFLSQSRSPLVKNVLKDAIIEFERINTGTLSKVGYRRKSRRSNKMELRGLYSRNHKPVDYLDNSANITKNTARGIIVRTGLSEDILSKPFSQLNNTEIQKLAIAMKNIN